LDGSTQGDAKCIRLYVLRNAHDDNLWRTEKRIAQGLPEVPFVGSRQCSDFHNSFYVLSSSQLTGQEWERDVIANAHAAVAKGRAIRESAAFDRGLTKQSFEPEKDFAFVARANYL